MLLGVMFGGALRPIVYLRIKNEILIKINKIKIEVNYDNGIKKDT